MPRALWKGAITFGLVYIPVGLYPAERRNSLDLTMLDRRNMEPVGYQRINKKTGREVPWEEIVKGYEYKKEKYVVLSDEDFRKANVKATQTIEIVSFVGADEIPLVYYDTPYYLAPGKRGEKPYALLREALERTGKVGIAYVVIRSRQHLAALVPMGNTLVLDTLRFSYEIRPAAKLEVPKGGAKSAGVRAKEMSMALKLMEDMSEKWDPEKYRDTYHDDVLERVKEKVKAGETEVVTEPEEPAAKPRSAEVIDLMTLLKGSMARKKPAAARRRRVKARRRAA